MTQRMLDSACHTFITLFPTAMTHDVHIRGQGKFPLATLFSFTQDSTMKASRSDVIVKKKLELILIHLVRK